MHLLQSLAAVSEARNNSDALRNDSLRFYTRVSKLFTRGSHKLLQNSSRAGHLCVM